MDGRMNGYKGSAIDIIQHNTGGDHLALKARGETHIVRPAEEREHNGGLVQVFLYLIK